MGDATVLLRLEGPTQGWGTAASRWDYRITAPRPTKSGVIGMVANAMGRDFDDPVDDLAALRYGIRADRPGHTEYDYRMAGGGTFPLDARTAFENPKLTASDTGRIMYGAPRATKNDAWTDAAREGVRRSFTFLADSAFLAALTGPAHLVAAIAQAVEQPARLVSLGRRADPPSQPLLYAVLDGDQHFTWADTTALLPTATTTDPVVVWETTPGTPGSTITYEQPPVGRTRGRGHGPICVVTTTVHPSPQEVTAS